MIWAGRGKCHWSNREHQQASEAGHVLPVWWQILENTIQTYTNICKWYQRVYYMLCIYILRMFLIHFFALWYKKKMEIEMGLVDVPIEWWWLTIFFFIWSHTQMAHAGWRQCAIWECKKPTRATSPHFAVTQMASPHDCLYASKCVDVARVSFYINRWPLHVIRLMPWMCDPLYMFMLCYYVDMTERMFWKRWRREVKNI